MTVTIVHHLLDFGMFQFVVVVVRHFPFAYPASAAERHRPLAYSAIAVVDQVHLAVLTIPAAAVVVDRVTEDEN